MKRTCVDEYLRGFRDCWTVCMQCSSCYYRGPIVPHNWRELPPFEWSSPTRKCPSFEYFKFRAYTPVGRGNLAALFFDDPNYPISDDLIKIAYTCTTCGMCSEICKAHDPLTAIWALRYELTRRGAQPPSPLPKVLSNIEEYNNIFGVTTRMLTEIPNKGKYVYFAGCDVRFRQPNLISIIKEILKRSGVDLAWLGSKERCCGFTAGQAGRIDLLERQAHLNVEELKTTGVEQVVVSCAQCYKTLKYDYPSLVDELPFEVKHISELYLSLIDKGKMLFPNRFPVSVVYHDPCYLGRHSNIYDEPRKVLESIPGVKLVEMARNRKWSWCCGEGAKIISLCYPDFSTAVAKEKLSEAAEANAEITVSACPSCVLHLGKVINNLKISMEVNDISVVFGKALKLIL